MADLGMGNLPIVMGDIQTFVQVIYSDKISQKKQKVIPE